MRYIVLDFKALRTVPRERAPGWAQIRAQLDALCKGASPPHQQDLAITSNAAAPPAAARWIQAPLASDPGCVFLLRSCDSIGHSSSSVISIFTPRQRSPPPVMSEIRHLKSTPLNIFSKMSRATCDGRYPSWGPPSHRQTATALRSWRLLGSGNRSSGSPTLQAWMIACRERPVAFRWVTPATLVKNDDMKAHWTYVPISGT